MPSSLGAPAELDPILRKALAKSPDDRYSNLSTMVDDLADVEKRLSRTQQPTPAIEAKPSLIQNPTFDPELIDSRPLRDWEINQSASVLKLDCPMLKPDRDGKLLVLRPSYAAAMKAADQHHWQLLPRLGNVCRSASPMFVMFRTIARNMRRK